MSEGVSTDSICGIIMPISRVDDDHDEAHWKQVLAVIEEAIGAAGLTPQPVWLNSDYDVIQAKILQNLFEHEIIVCDVSTRNANVMLELGMRLTTKRPTIIIAEIGTKLPFDTSVINTEFYDPTLKYADISAFVKRLAKMITDTYAAAKAGTYQGYLETFKFETVKPASVTVTGDVAVAERLEEMNSRLIKLSYEIGELQRPAARLSDMYLRNLFSSEPSNENSVHDPVVNTLQHIFPNERAKLAALGSHVDRRIQLGSIVSHKKFGEGVVVAIDGAKLKVKFPNFGIKQTMSAFVDPIVSDEETGAPET